MSISSHYIKMNTLNNGQATTLTNGATNGQMMDQENHLINTSGEFGLTNDQIQYVTKVYITLKSKLNHSQVSMLATMIYRLDQEYATKEIIEREKIKLDSYTKRTSWKNVVKTSSYYGNKGGPQP